MARIKDENMKEFEGQLGYKIRITREYLRVTQTRLGEEIGATQRQVTSWENGHVAPHVLHLFKLAKLVNVSVDDFVSLSAARFTIKLFEVNK